MRKLPKFICIVTVLCLAGLRIRPSITQTLPVLELPIATAPTRSYGQSAQMTSVQWMSIAHKFRCNVPIKSLPNLLHHVGNRYPDWIPSDPDNVSRTGLLGKFLNDNLPSNYEPNSEWLFRGIDGRPHLSQRVDPGAEGHPSQLIAELATAGVPSSLAIRSGGTSASIAELIRSLREDFHLDGEIEWKSMALARYAPTREKWVNRWGQSYDFDTITSELLRRGSIDGSCSGTHLLQALAVILRVDAVVPCLSQDYRNSIHRHLATVINVLEGSQREEGYWAPDWFLIHPNRSDYKMDRSIFSEEQLALATGHHLEWIDMLAGDLVMDADAHRSAVNWCYHTLRLASQEAVTKNFCAYSHCFRAVMRNVRLQDKFEEGRTR